MYTSDLASDLSLSYDSRSGTGTPTMISKGEFTQYPFFLRFRPFFYVFASP